MNKLPKNYNPLYDNSYMSANMRLYFKQRLKMMLKDQTVIEELHYNNLPLQEQEYLLRKQIEDAIQALENCRYGYCKKTGTPIGVEILEHNPLAEYCPAAQHEEEKA